MTIDCAFVIASAKFRILQKSIETIVENTDHIVKAVCILHNITSIIDREKDTARPTSLNEKQPITLLMVRRNKANNRSSRFAKNIRNTFTSLFEKNKI